MRQQLDAPVTLVTRRSLLALAATTVATVGIPAGIVQARQEGTPSALDLPDPSPIASSLTPDASPVMQAVAAAVVEAMAAAMVPGAAVGILVGDREEHAVFGVSSTSSLRPVTPETLFQIGSVSKTVTSTAIWRLIDEGVLDLDAPLRSYLPELTLMDQEVAEQVTVKNLLDHSAGWYGDEGIDTGENDDALEQYVAERLPQLPQVFPLGEFFSYNNSAFTVLGRLIEVSTGTTYRAAIRNLLLDPLGMDASLIAPGDVLQHPYADGHVAMEVNGQVALAIATPLWVPRSVEPAGGIWSTTRDLMRYGRFHLSAGTMRGPAAIVQPESLAQMREPAMPIPGASTVQMGRDWFVQDLDGVRVAFHGGDTLGQHAELIMIPEHDVVIAVLTNGQVGGTAVAFSALNALLSAVPTLEPLVGRVGFNADLAVPADASPIDMTSEDLMAYIGRFADPGQIVTFSLEDGGLVVLIENIVQPGAYLGDLTPSPMPPIPVGFVAKDMGTLGPGLLPFVRDAEGIVQWVSIGLRLIPRVD